MAYLAMDVNLKSEREFQVKGIETMQDPSTMKYVCIHGHFYQPPRENPWLEELEKEESAAPYHDWNERIHRECYRPNAAARFMGDNNRILGIHNNYRSLSFNFGATLLSWLERHDSWTYRAVLEADRESCVRLGGHGNALAQVYNHLIMPLANRRDKISQVLWGIRDFETRFGRAPEGMWLAETAVDRETLAIMAEAGIVFTILSPCQALQWRFLEDDAPWQDVQNGGIPTGRPYLYDCGNGKSIHLFFYDDQLARGIAFERYLEHSSKLLNEIHLRYAFRPAREDEPWLIHTATDGESYGHHAKFGDMGLAATFRDLESDPQGEVINYGAFLSRFPVRAQVEIKENTAWSCAHGLGRWERDCGCHIGGEPGWNQQWRAPLREALHCLRDTLAAFYEEKMGRLCQDPWEVRNAYIEILLNPHEKEPFFFRHVFSGIDREEMPLFFQLLEMQRCSMLMFISCGWFFDDISGLESVLILRHAARSIQLAERTGALPLEPSFLKILANAPSNLPEFGNGANVYLKRVKPHVISREHVAANYAFQSLARSSHRQYRIYCFDILPEKERNLGPNPFPFLCGHIRIREERTLEVEDYLYAVLHFGGLDFRCSVKRCADGEEYELILKALEQGVEEQDTVKIIRVLDERFGSGSFSLHDAFADLRASIAREISENTLADCTGIQRHLYQMYRPLIASLGQWGIPIPVDLLGAVQRVLSDEAASVLRDILMHEKESVFQERSWDATDFFYRAHFGRLQSLLQEAETWGTSLHLHRIKEELGKTMVESLTKLHRTFAPRHAGRFYRLMSICKLMGCRPETWKLQTLYFQMVTEGRKKPEIFTRISNFYKFLVELDSFLGCSFADFPLELARPSSKEVVASPSSSTA